MKNECSVVFLCMDSEKNPCTSPYRSRGMVCKHRKVFGDTASCTSKKARIDAMETKIKKLKLKR